MLQHTSGLPFSEKIDKYNLDLQPSIASQSPQGTPIFPKCLLSFDLRWGRGLEMYELLKGLLSRWGTEEVAKTHCFLWQSKTWCWWKLRDLPWFILLEWMEAFKSWSILDEALRSLNWMGGWDREFMYQLGWFIAFRFIGFDSTSLINMFFIIIRRKWCQRMLYWPSESVLKNEVLPLD